MHQLLLYYSASLLNRATSGNIFFFLTNLLKNCPGQNYTANGGIKLQRIAHVFPHTAPFPSLLCPQNPSRDFKQLLITSLSLLKRGREQERNQERESETFKELKLHCHANPLCLTKPNQSVPLSHTQTAHRHAQEDDPVNLWSPGAV